MTFGQDKRILLRRRAYRLRLAPQRYPAFEAALITGRQPEVPIERAAREGLQRFLRGASRAEEKGARNKIFHESRVTKHGLFSRASTVGW